MKYTYLTEKIEYGLSAKKLLAKFDELLQSRAQEGWRLVKYEFCEWLGCCVVVFEKEAD